MGRVVFCTLFLSVTNRTKRKHSFSFFSILLSSANMFCLFVGVEACERYVNEIQFKWIHFRSLFIFFYLNSTFHIPQRTCNVLLFSFAPPPLGQIYHRCRRLPLSMTGINMDYLCFFVLFRLLFIIIIIINI